MHPPVVLREYQNTVCLCLSVSVCVCVRFCVHSLPHPIKRGGHMRHMLQNSSLVESSSSYHVMDSFPPGQVFCNVILSHCDLFCNSEDDLSSDAAGGAVVQANHFASDHDTEQQQRSLLLRWPWQALPLSLLRKQGT